MVRFRGSKSLPSHRSQKEQKKLVVEKSNGIFSTTSVKSKEGEYSDPLFAPPPALGIHKSSILAKYHENIESRYNSTKYHDILLEQYRSSDALLKIQLRSAHLIFHFNIPVSLLIEREQIMRETAKSSGITAEQWTSSLLYREWVEANEDSDDLSSHAPNDDCSKIETQKHSNGDVTLHLHPERDCSQSNHSQSFTWTPNLSTCIRAFYNTGTVRIPSDCVGSDVLLALEYFGIIYSPEQIIFDSFGAYLRVKIWSEYYTYRALLAKWIMTTLLESPSKHSHLFVTSPTLIPSCVSIFVGSTRGQLMDGSLKLDPAKYSGLPSCAVVHDFFHNEEIFRGESGDSSMEPMDEVMRQDFATYIQASLPGTNVTFSVRNDVTVAGNSKNLQRAVLHIDLLSAVSVKSRGILSESESICVSMHSAIHDALPPLPAKHNILQQTSSMDHANHRLKREQERKFKNINQMQHSTSLDKVKNDMTKNSREFNDVFQKIFEENSSMMSGKMAQRNRIDSHDPILPIRSVCAGDQVTVDSGLTNPWKEDETILLLQNETKKVNYSNQSTQQSGENTSGNIVAKLQKDNLDLTVDANDISSSSKSTGNNDSNNGNNSKLNTVNITVTKPYSPGNRTTMISSRNPSDNLCPEMESFVNSKVELQIEENSAKKPHIQCDAMGALSSAFSFLFWNKPKQYSTHEYKSGKANNLSNYENDIIEEEKSDIEFEWWDNTIPFKKFIYDDPVPDKEDEYLRLAREASKIRPRNFGIQSALPLQTYVEDKAESLINTYESDNLSINDTTTSGSSTSNIYIFSKPDCFIPVKLTTPSSTSKPQLNSLSVREAKKEAISMHKTMEKKTISREKRAIEFASSYRCQFGE